MLAILFQFDVPCPNQASGDHPACGSSIPYWDTCNGLLAQVGTMTRNQFYGNTMYI